MPDNSPPQVPNYVPGVGSLVTYRQQFEEHITGTNFRQNADSIDVIPNIVIGDTVCTNVMDTLRILVQNTVVPTVDQATVGTALSNLGIITLGGDLSGTSSTALSPKVAGLQGRPVSNSEPSTGNVLTWNGSSWGPASGFNFIPNGDLSGTSSSQMVIGIQGRPVLNTVPSTNQILAWNGSAWSPTNGAIFTAGGDLSGTSTSQSVIGINGIPISLTSLSSGQVLQYNGTRWVNVNTTSFTAGGDLIGTNTAQQVTNLSGSGSPLTVTVSANNIEFDINAIPYISQSYVSGSNAAEMVIKAQGISGGVGVGGNLLLAGGPNHTSYNLGGVSMSIGGDPTIDTNAHTIFQVAQIDNGINPKVASFFPPSASGITTSDIPGTVDGTSFIYIGDTTTPPTGPATTGSLLWSYGGVLYVMQENGVNFPIAASSIPVVNKAYFGDGYDGAVVFDGRSNPGTYPMATLNGTTYTLDRGIATNSVVVADGYTLITNGWGIFCTGTLTNNGIIDNSGKSGAAGGAGAPNQLYGGGTAGGAGDIGFGPGNGMSYLSGFSATAISFGGNGGQGGNSGGTGGTVYNPGDYFMNGISPISLIVGGFNLPTVIGGSPSTSSVTLWGGAGGGGGTATPFGLTDVAYADGGSGGGGGGYMLIAAQELTGTGTYTANGGNGQSGFVNDGYAGAGGGGGGGGVVVIVYGSTTLSNIPISVNGGVGGAGGIGIGHPNGLPGNAGFNGYYTVIQG